MFKAITFDLDNTLIDFMLMKKASSNAAAKAMVKAGLNMSVKQAEKELFTEYIKDIEGEHVFQDFLTKHEANSDKILAAALNAYLQTKYKYMKPYSSVKPVLRKLKKQGIKLAIVTDAPRLKAFQRLDALGITDFFDIVIGFEDTRQHKPNSAPFKKALKALNVKPKEVLHIGDWLERDIAGAQNVGMIAAWAKYGGNTTGKKVKPDFTLNKFDDLLNIIF